MPQCSCFNRICNIRTCIGSSCSAAVALLDLSLQMWCAGSPTQTYRYHQQYSCRLYSFLAVHHIYSCTPCSIPKRAPTNCSNTAPTPTCKGDFTPLVHSIYSQHNVQQSAPKLLLPTLSRHDGRCRLLCGRCSQEQTAPHTCM
jgi:hypothetical protein